MIDQAPPMIWTISIISHGHGSRILRGILDMHRHLQETAHQFVLTFNAGEDVSFLSQLPPSAVEHIRIIQNPKPRGFAANHNAALKYANSRYVLAADPDLKVRDNVFPALQKSLADPACGIVAPLAHTSQGMPDDNGRSLTTPTRILQRVLMGRGRDRPPVDFCGAREVDWLAGLFLAMRSDTFDALGGFDDRYFMYCEDVDLCLRARQMGLHITQRCDLHITHDANRKTLKRLSHLIWHFSSLIKLWRSTAYRAA